MGRALDGEERVGRSRQAEEEAPVEVEVEDRVAEALEMLLVRGVGDREEVVSARVGAVLALLRFGVSMSR